MIVSYSELFKFDTCQRQYYYSFGLGLRPVETSAPMDTGNKGHRLLQDFYSLIREGETKEHARRIIEQQSTNMVREMHGSEVGNLIKAWTLVDNYIRDTDFTSEAILVENRFLIPAQNLMRENFLDDYYLEGVQIGFTPDVVFERKGGNLDVEDAKFVGRAWSKSKLNRFQQAKLYQIFLNHMLYNVTRTTVRFFNTTTGKINEQNYVLPKAEEAILIDEFLRGVIDVVKFRKQHIAEQKLARRTTNYTACQFCPFEFPCTLEAEGKDATKTFKAEYVKSDYDYSK